MGNMSDLNMNVEEEAKGMHDSTPIPEGEYDVICTEASLDENKASKGSHVSATMQVIEGEHSGRMFWVNYNVQNENSVAERIGRSELAALCQAIGLTKPDDTADLLNKPFKVKLGFEKNKDLDANNKPMPPTKNKVKAYMSSDAPSAPKEEAKPAPKAAPSAAKPLGSKPWQKK